MKIVVNLDKGKLNSYNTTQKYTQFLQSFEWGEFQETVGNKVLRIGIEDGGRLVFAVSLIKKKLPGINKSYLYAPRINISSLNEKQQAFLIVEIKKIAKNEKAIFLRFDPVAKSTFDTPSNSAGRRHSTITRTIDVQPSKTLILDIGKAEVELLKDMHQKTRYNIRLSEKKRVGVHEAEDLESDFRSFWNIMEETKERDQFRLHGKGYYETMLRCGGMSGMSIKLLLAEYEGEIIAGNILAFFGDMVTYVHGASSNKYRNVMAPFALQWQAIKMAKQHGFKYYDFNGFDEKKWPGVTRFKRGFGGEEVEYPGTFDVIFDSAWYKAYMVIRKIRRMV